MDKNIVNTHQKNVKNASILKIVQNKREILKTRDPVKTKFEDDFHSDKGQQVYYKRAPLIESIFGVNKFNRNYSNLRRNGIEKSVIDLQLIAISHNMKIIYDHSIKNIS